jgi:hypothetical protein
MNLDWLKIGLIVFAIWLLSSRSKSGDKQVDWPELLAIAIIAQVVSDLWREV